MCDAVTLSLRTRDRPQGTLQRGNPRGRVNTIGGHSTRARARIGSWIRFSRENAAAGQFRRLVAIYGGSTARRNVPFRCTRAWNCRRCARRCWPHAESRHKGNAQTFCPLRTKSQTRTTRARRCWPPGAGNGKHTDRRRRVERFYPTWIEALTHTTRNASLRRHGARKTDGLRSSRDPS